MSLRDALTFSITATVIFLIIACIAVWLVGRYENRKTKRRKK